MIIDIRLNSSHFKAISSILLSIVDTYKFGSKELLIIYCPDSLGLDYTNYNYNTGNDSCGEHEIYQGNNEVTMIKHKLISCK